MPQPVGYSTSSNDAPIGIITGGCSHCGGDTQLVEDIDHRGKYFRKCIQCGREDLNHCYRFSDEQIRKISRSRKKRKMTLHINHTQEFPENGIMKKEKRPAEDEQEEEKFIMVPADEYSKGNLRFPALNDGKSKNGESAKDKPNQSEFPKPVPKFDSLPDRRKTSKWVLMLEPYKEQILEEVDKLGFDPTAKRWQTGTKVLQTCIKVWVKPASKSSSGIAKRLSDKAQNASKTDGVENHNTQSTGIHVGMPAYEYLEIFAELVYDTFGTPPYLVGSALETKNWRDVDVRLILDEQQWKHWQFGSPSTPYRNHTALTLAFTELGRKMTGLPIDFQIQHQRTANGMYPGRRSALGVIHRAPFEQVLNG